MNLQRLSALIGKESRELIRDPITVWLAVLMPLVMLYLFGYAVTLDVKGVSLGIYDEDRSPASRELIDRFAATENFTLRRRFHSFQEVEAATDRRHGERDCFAVFHSACGTETGASLYPDQQPKGSGRQSLGLAVAGSSFPRSRRAGCWAGFPAAARRARELDGKIA